MKKGLFLLTVIVLLIIFSIPAMAIEIIDTEETPVTFGVGMETFGFLSYGISGTYNILDQVAVQGIVGIPTDFMSQSLSGVKLMYRFAKGEARNYYLFGMGGVVSVSTSYPETTTTGTGWVAGLGVEYSPSYLPDVIRSSIEIGYMETSLPEWPTSLYYNFGLRFYF